MLEIGLSGSEGGVVQPNAPSLPLCAPARVLVQSGESPLAGGLRHGCWLSNPNCVWATRGGEQGRENDRSVNR